MSAWVCRNCSGYTHFLHLINYFIHWRLAAIPDSIYLNLFSECGVKITVALSLALLNFLGEWKHLTRYKRTGHPTMCVTMFSALSFSWEFGPNDTKRYVPPMVRILPRNDSPYCSEITTVYHTNYIKSVPVKSEMCTCVHRHIFLSHYTAAAEQEVAVCTSALRPIKHLHSMQQIPCYLHLSAIFSSNT